MNKILMIKSIAGLSCVALVGCLLLPLFAQSKAQASPKAQAFLAGRRNAFEEIGKEMAAGNLQSAEAHCLLLAEKNPKDAKARQLLADVYSAEHRYEAAYETYRPIILPNIAGVGASDVLFRFGDAAVASGHPDEAKVAYRRVIQGLQAQVDKNLLDSAYAPNVEARDLRLVGKSLIAAIYHEPGYLAAVQGAVREAPRQPVTHFLYATVLVEFGHFKDASDQVDAAAALLPPGEAHELRERSAVLFGFDRLDHGSRGVIDKYGKVTFTRFPTPLRNSSRPLVEAPMARTQGPVRP